MKSIALLALTGVLVLSGCGGGEEEPAGGSAPSGQAQTGAYSYDGPPQSAGPGGGGAAPARPLPKVSPQQVTGLVGTWRGSTAARDYFAFNADGTGLWMAQGRALWRGQVIPEGKGRFRLSWQGGDPQQASYWSVRLIEGGKKIVFEGTNQTYAKAAR